MFENDEDTPKSRHTPVHDRYQITDACCGLVATSTSLNKASLMANAHAARHRSEPDNTVETIVVFDTMAKRDCQDTWTFAVQLYGAMQPSKGE